MKTFFKKITLAICAAAASAMLFTAYVPALASSEGFRSGPGETSAAADTITTNSGSSSGEQAAESGTDSAAAEANDVTSQTAASSAKVNKRYLTKWGGFFWFLLSVIVNFILSCWVGNRFYRMARKSAQGSGEIRALRKDIEEKFALTLQGIEEPAVEVINRNESYARADEGIAMPERRQRVEMKEEELEMMRRWDSKRAAVKESSREREEDYDEDFDYAPEPRKTAKRSYQPTRRSSGIEFDDEEYGDEEYEDYEEARREKKNPTRRGKSAETLSNAKNKAKDFLNNVFPFDE